uniref:Saccharopine dehydrogenase n=1 Tax=Peronospora matthiolae TaxID=2874970 RepID=A0AAV1TNY4_9STRA
MVAAYASSAAKTGAVLVNCCGFESIPSDLTTFLMSDYIRHNHHSSTGVIDLYFTGMKGEPSGGTLASAFAIMDTSSSEQLRASRNPFFLTDEKTIAGKKAAGLVEPNASGILVRYDMIVRTWHSLFIGGPINQAIVHRSNYLLQNKYGNNFVYRERMAIGGFFTQVLVTIGTIIVATALYFGWTRALLKRLVRAPGQGPSEESMLQGYFVADAVGYTDDGKVAVRTKVAGSGDPGYYLTSRLVSECAFCLAKDEFGESTCLEGGFYTPASAFGRKLVDRLQQKKLMTFELKNVDQTAAGSGQML